MGERDGAFILVAPWAGQGIGPPALAVEAAASEVLLFDHYHPVPYTPSPQSWLSILTPLQEIPPTCHPDRNASNVNTSFSNAQTPLIYFQVLAAAGNRPVIVINPRLGGASLLEKVRQKMASFGRFSSIAVVRYCG